MRKFIFCPINFLLNLNITHMVQSHKSQKKKRTENKKREARTVFKALLLASFVNSLLKLKKKTSWHVMKHLWWDTCTVKYQAYKCSGFKAVIMANISLWIIQNSYSTSKLLKGGIFENSLDGWILSTFLILKKHIGFTREQKI